MLRLIEVALFLVPFVVVLVWRLLPVREPSLRMVVVCCALLVALAAALLVVRSEDAEPGGSAYIPPHMEDGHIIPGSHGPQ